MSPIRGEHVTTSSELEPSRSDAADLDLAEVQRQLGLPVDTRLWLEQMERPAGERRLVLPDDEEASRLLERLDVDPQDRADVLAARPDPKAHPAHWWVLDRMYHDELASMGKGLPIEGLRAWPALPAGTGPVGRHLYVWLYLAVLPEVRRHHANRGIADDISWASLLFGGLLRVHRQVTGESGLGLFDLWGTPARLRGAYYPIGRLEFNRGAISLGNGKCGYAVAVHVPGGGRLDADACDQSMAQAAEFFTRHYPEEPIAFFTCRSWLLDPQLAEYLPPNSNIVRFQRRFKLMPFLSETDHAKGDAFILGYVFGQAPSGSTIPSEVLDQLPQDTTFQRAYVAHLRSGRHWHERTGWLSFHDSQAA